MSFQQELDIYLRARFTLIILVTQEEERGIQTIKQVCLQNQRPCISWDVADGFISITNDKASLPNAKDALTALEQIEKASTDTLFILKDFHDCWKNDTIKRKLRSVKATIRCRTGGQRTKSGVSCKRWYCR